MRDDRALIAFIAGIVVGIALAVGVMILALYLAGELEP